MSPRKNRRRNDSPQGSYPTCGACRQRITFVKMTDTGASMPVDPFPEVDGNVCATPSGGTLAGFVITKKRPPVKGYKRYAAHWGTCPARDRPRRPAPAPEPSTLFD